ncbi:MAG: DUF2147 domain-containing protein [Proteobacteria bacterium]|nr:DUF2147 domain-containing protein [Pseudomonadota bacterium]
MRYAPLCTAAALAALASAAPAHAASPYGRWLTTERGGVVELFACGSALCGRIAGSPELDAHPDRRDDRNKDPAQRGRRLKGMVFMTGFTGGPREWSGGQIYRATNGSTYSGSVSLVDDNTLKLTGCIMKPLCQTQVWHRAR